MARVCNSFQVQFDLGSHAERAKVLAQKLFEETNYRIQDEFLVWDNMEVSALSLEGEVYCSGEDEECEQSRAIFERLCKTIAANYPEDDFMGRHSFDYTNTDGTLYLLCFYHNNKLVFYQGEVIDDVGCMNPEKFSYRVENDQFIETERMCFDNIFFDTDEDSDNEFVRALNLYEWYEFPDEDM